MIKFYYVYIMASRKNGTIYIGVTNNLERRVLEHKSGLIKGFTSNYGIKTLVYYECTGDVSVAIQKETQFKKWRRAWKIRLIEENNPNWLDISIR
jgi:putative endonuclease